MGDAAISEGRVVENRPVCRAHLRMSITVPGFAPAEAGQFVHVCPALNGRGPLGVGGGPNPLLRRAFSIAALVRDSDCSTVDIIYRVVGTGTQWLSSLRAGDVLSVLGPLGNTFPIDPSKSHAWLVCGGVGLPPMLWLAEALAAANVRSVAFCGAQSRDLLALTPDAAYPPAEDASAAVPAAREFAAHGVPVVVSTDDGSVGFEGHIGEALVAFHDGNPIDPAQLVVYTCGPERMMRYVADFCAEHGITCHVCMERAMGCGLGTCQSCVIPVRDAQAPDGWRYELCCSDGPVFDATRIIWDQPR